MFLTGTRLRAIKALHTAAWAVFAGAIVALPVAAWRGAFHVAFGLIGLISVELVILAANGGRCPLTAVCRPTHDRTAAKLRYLSAGVARAVEQDDLRGDSRRWTAGHRGSLAAEDPRVTRDTWGDANRVLRS